MGSKDVNDEEREGRLREVAVQCEMDVEGEKNDKGGGGRIHEEGVVKGE